MMGTSCVLTPALQAPQGRKAACGQGCFLAMASTWQAIAKWSPNWPFMEGQAHVWLRFLTQVPLPNPAGADQLAEHTHLHLLQPGLEPEVITSV